MEGTQGGIFFCLVFDIIPIRLCSGAYCLGRLTNTLQLNEIFEVLVHPASSGSTLGEGFFEKA